MFVKPAAGRLVRDPITRVPLPDAGAEKPASSFWLRRLRDGDVVEATPPTPPAPSAPQEISR